MIDYYFLSVILQFNSGAIEQHTIHAFSTELMCNTYVSVVVDTLHASPKPDNVASAFVGCHAIAIPHLV